MSKSYIELLEGDILNELSLSGELEKFLKQESDPSLQFKITTEMKCFDLFLSDGNLKPVIEWGDYIRTDVSKITIEEQEYIKERLEGEPNNFCRARYAHILFLLTKNRQFAIRAIEAYQTQVEEYIQLLETEKKCNIDVIEVVTAYHNLSAVVKHNLSEVKHQILVWYHLSSKSLFFYQCFIELISESKLFKRTDLKSFTKNALQLIHYVDSESDSERFLEACLCIGIKEGVDIKPIYQMLAEAQLQFAEKREDDSGIITANCYLKAALLYKKANNSFRSNEILRLLEDHKKNIKLGVIKHESSNKHIQEHFHSLREFARNIVVDTKNSPFIVLACHKQILVNTDRYKEPKDTFLNHCTVSTYDININTHILNDYEKRMRDKFMNVKIHYELSLLPLIKEIKTQMKMDGRDYLEDGMKYFQETWLSAELMQTVLSEEPVSYQWFSSLKPAFTSLLKVAEDDKQRLLNAEEQMAFDQLVIKFEGLLRDLCQLAKLTVTKVKEDQIVALNLNELLQNEELYGCFEKEDIQLWQNIFTACGYDIRNNVAHSFYRPKDYTVKKACLILFSYIRLAKYGGIVDKARFN